MVLRLEWYWEGATQYVLMALPMLGCLCYQQLLFCIWYLSDVACLQQPPLLSQDNMSCIWQRDWSPQNSLQYKCWSLMNQNAVLFLMSIRLNPIIYLGILGGFITEMRNVVLRAFFFLNSPSHKRKKICHYHRIFHYKVVEQRHDPHGMSILIIAKST